MLDVFISDTENATLRARRKLLKDAASKVEATVFDEEVPSEDEDGEENLVLGDGAFGGQV